MSAWSIIVVRKVGDRFHQNFAMGLKAHPLWYRGVNIAISITFNKQKSKGNYNGTNESKGACCNKTTTICFKVANFERKEGGGVKERLGIETRRVEHEKDQNSRETRRELGGTRSHEPKEDKHDQDCEPKRTRSQEPRGGQA